MHAKFLVVGLAGLLLTGSARAGDVVRTSLPDPYNAPTVSLKADLADLDADTVLAFHRGGFHGGYRGGYGGYRGGYYGGYRGGYAGGYRHYGGYYGGYSPRFYGGYYGGYSSRYYGGYYPRYYGGYYGGYYPRYYGYYGGYSSYYPCVYYYSSGSVIVTTCLPRTAVVQNGTLPPNGSALPPPSGNSNGPRPNGSVPPNGSSVPGGPPPGDMGNGTFQYDGGPTEPIPMPNSGTGAPMVEPRGPIVDYDLLVKYTQSAKTGTSTPTKGKWVYPAYGETPRRTGEPSR